MLTKDRTTKVLQYQTRFYIFNNLKRNLNSTLEIHIKYLINSMAVLIIFKRVCHVKTF